ncbi:MAG: NAD-dependent epimerase/dehydratase family protein [Acidobacteria bacterium]|nr:NAD-dependent epimerase/dehydratase family protein [Acidobacteriota bacterium]
MNEVETQRLAFVTGATGCIGSALVTKLVHDGWRIVALVRDRNRASHLPVSVELVEASLADQERIATAMQGCQTVFHLAAKVHAAPGTPLKEFERENVAGTRNVITAAIENRAKRFVFFSTVAVYGESEKIQDEAQFPRPTTAYGASKFDAEQIVLEQTELNATVLRLPVVYGAYDRGNVASLIQAIRRNRYFIVGDGQNLKSMVAVENVVDAALFVADDERAIGKTYNVTDARPYSQEEIAATIAELLGSRKPLKLPRWLLMLAGKTGDLVENLTGLNLPVSSDRIRKLSSNTIYSAAKIKYELGFEPRVELREGLIQAINSISKSQFGI